MDKVEAAIRRRYNTNSAARDHYVALWHEYSAAELADANFVSEITGDKDAKFWQRLWEMMLGRHLSRLGHRLSSAGEGPDFRFEVEGKTVWCEAVMPDPKDLPGDWLTLPEPGEVRVHSVPYEAMLLRWTAALKEKHDKLEGRTKKARVTGEDVFKPGYRQKGIVADGDCYVIAVNSCQLSAFPKRNGISGLPFAVETVFPVGPWAFPVLAEQGRLGDPFRTVRRFVKNHNGSPVATTGFLDPAYAGVSALLGCTTANAQDGDLGLIVVHNPLARVPLPVGVLGAAVEYVAHDVGDAYELHPAT
jgi:hypothetical protein